jgi:hypothetical protein
VVATFSGGFLEGFQDFFVVDEFLGVNGLGVVHGQNKFKDTKVVILIRFVNGRIRIFANYM